jgi:hypothetical protein
METVQNGLRKVHGKAMAIEKPGVWPPASDGNLTRKLRFCNLAVE